MYAVLRSGDFCEPGTEIDYGRKPIDDEWKNGGNNAYNAGTRSVGDQFSSVILDPYLLPHRRYLLAPKRQS